VQTSSSDAKSLNAGYCLIFVPFCAAYDFAKTSECFGLCCLWSIPIYKDVMIRLWCFSKYVSVFIFLIIVW